MATKYRSIPELTPQEIERFWSKVDKTPGHGPMGECWLWTASAASPKYGKFSTQAMSFGAHRVAYRLGHGEDPGDRLVCHKCDVMKCCNPAHLFTGTHLDNVHDAMSKGRHAKGERHAMTIHPELRKNLRKPHGRKRHVFGSSHISHIHPQRVQGANNGRATLTEEQVQSIRTDRAAGMSYAQIAQRNQTSKSIVAHIVTGKTWRSLPSRDVDGTAVC